MPQAFPEPDMPPMHTCAQRLLVSTIPTWQDLSRWYWKLSEPRMAATVPEMQETVDALVAGAASRDERIWRVFTYVSQKIRYMGVTPEEEAPGYEPHDVKLTFQNKYGVCRDKAALLAAMLRMAGVEAYPVLIHVGERRDPDVAQIFFNHAIVAAVSEKPGAVGADRYILMDPTNENSARLLPEYLCEKSFLVATPEGEALPRIPGPARRGEPRPHQTPPARSATACLRATTTVRLAGIQRHDVPRRPRPAGPARPAAVRRGPAPGPGAGRPAREPAHPAGRTCRTPPRRCPSNSGMSRIAPGPPARPASLPPSRSSPRRSAT